MFLCILGPTLLLLSLLLPLLLSLLCFVGVMMLQWVVWASSSFKHSHRIVLSLLFQILLLLLNVRKKVFGSIRRRLREIVLSVSSLSSSWFSPSAALFLNVE